MKTIVAPLLPARGFGVGAPVRRQLRFKLEIVALTAVGVGLVLAGLALPTGRAMGAPHAKTEAGPDSDAATPARAAQALTE